MKDEEIVMRYKVLFHDASPSMIEHLIRKLMKEMCKDLLEQNEELRLDNESLKLQVDNTGGLI